MATATFAPPFVVDTARDGFGILEAVASRADAGYRSWVQLTTASATALGVTVGLIAYLDRLGITTGRLEDDYALRGPRQDPQYFYLAEVEVTIAPGLSTLQSVCRLRIAEVKHAVIGLDDGGT